MYTRSEIKAGAVILASAALCAVALVAAGRFGSFFAKKQTLRVLFTDVQGLKVDDPVQVMGLECGKVRALTVAHYQDQAGLSVPAVEVTARIAYPEPLADDTKVMVDCSLTGSTVLKIEPGRSAQRLGPDQRLMGAAPVSMTEIANKAGLMVKRIDEFVADVTDRNISGAVRASVLNLKKVSDEARTVMTSLNQTVPGTEASLDHSVKNIESLSKSLRESLAGNQARISETVINMHAASQSLARVGENMDQLVARSKEPVHGAVSDAAKAAANMKALTREVRWQPWLLLHKPNAADIRERSVYNAALEFSEGAESLNGAVQSLAAYMAAAKGDAAKLDSEKFKGLVAQIHASLENSAALEQRLWQQLTEKSREKLR
ncbi:MAG: MlaD family protein [Elusimicrobia bacterium]|nr:MlaD family protein [Elusimicrobiota bacterium]